MNALRRFGLYIYVYIYNYIYIIFHILDFLQVARVKFSHILDTFASVKFSVN
jgi:hypothetical protein